MYLTKKDIHPEYWDVGVNRVKRKTLSGVTRRNVGMFLPKFDKDVLPLGLEIAHWSVPDPTESELKCEVVVII